MSTTIASKQTSTAPQQPSIAPQQPSVTPQPTPIAPQQISTTPQQTTTQPLPPEHHHQADPPRSKHHPLLPSTMTLLKTLPPSTTLVPNPNEHPSGSALATRALVSDTPVTNLTASSAAHDLSEPTQDDDGYDDDNDEGDDDNDNDPNDPGTATPPLTPSGLKTPVGPPPPTTTITTPSSFPPPNAIEYHTHGLSTPHSRHAIATRKREQTKQLLASLDEHPTGSNPLGIVGAGGRAQARGYSSTSGGLF